MQTSLLNFEAIGTHWAIDIADPLSAPLRTEIIDKITSLIDEFDRTYSRFRNDSTITSMAHKKGKYQLPDNAEKLFSLYKSLYELTDGAFTPLIGQVLDDAGYDPIYSLSPKQLHTPPKWEEIIDFNSSTITIKKPAMLDFGAGGKGYLIDLVAELLEKNKINTFCIDAGGDILFHSIEKQTLRVGLEHPENPSQIIGIASIYDQSICASAANRRHWGNMHHIINPHTLTSPHNIKATWVVAKSALLADSIATCLFLVPPEKLRSQYIFSYAIVRDDFSLQISNDFPAKNVY